MSLNSQSEDGGGAGGVGDWLWGTTRGTACGKGRGLGLLSTSLRGPRPARPPRQMGGVVEPLVPVKIPLPFGIGGVGGETFGGATIAWLWGPALRGTRGAVFGGPGSGGGAVKFLGTGVGGDEGGVGGGCRPPGTTSITPPETRLKVKALDGLSSMRPPLSTVLAPPTGGVGAPLDDPPPAPKPWDLLGGGTRGDKPPPGEGLRSAGMGAAGGGGDGPLGGGRSRTGGSA